MSTHQEVMQDLEKFGETALRVKAERDALLAACKRAYIALDARYDVDRTSDGGFKEYPFSGAGEVMNALKAAIDKAVA